MQQADASHNPELIIKFLCFWPDSIEPLFDFMNHAQFDHYNPDLDRHMARSKKFLDADKIFYKGGQKLYIATNAITKTQGIDTIRSEQILQSKNFYTSQLLTNV